MKRRTISALVVGTVLGLGGCQDFQSWFEPDNAVARFKKCTDSAQGQSLSVSTARVFCINKHQREIKAEMTGGARYFFPTEAGTYFDGSVSNKSTNYVVTSYRINVLTSSNTMESKVFKDYWIEPGGTGYFLIGADELVFKATKENSPEKSWGWSVDQIKGLLITTPSP